MLTQQSSVSHFNPGNLASHFLPDMPSQARRLFYIGYCRAKLGEEEAARRLAEVSARELD